MVHREDAKSHRENRAPRLHQSRWPCGRFERSIPGADGGGIQRGPSLVGHWLGPEHCLATFQCLVCILSAPPASVVPDPYCGKTPNRRLQILWEVGSNQQFFFRIPISLTGLHFLPSRAGGVCPLQGAAPAGGPPPMGFLPQDCPAEALTPDPGFPSPLPSSPSLRLGVTGHHSTVLSCFLHSSHCFLSVPLVGSSFPCLINVGAPVNAVHGLLFFSLYSQSRECESIHLYSFSDHRAVTEMSLTTAAIQDPLS